MIVKEEMRKHTSYNSGYPVSLPLVATPKLLPSVATSGSRQRCRKPDICVDNVSYFSHIFKGDPQTGILVMIKPLKN